MIRFYEPYPLFIGRGSGSKIWDADGNEYIDYCMGYGPLIAGHSHPKIVEAVREQAEKGTAYGMPHAKTGLLIKELLKRFPMMDMVCFTNSGVEAVSHVLRIARSHTGKDKIVKVEGCYHGGLDSVELSVGPPLDKAGPSESPVPYPESAGIPAEILKQTYVVPYNNVAAVENLFEKHGDEIAAMILEPIMLNSGCVLPKPNYLKELRRITKEHDALLIFDEIKTGCRITPGSVEEIYHVKPDMITLAKAIGGGLPLGAFCGPKKLMEELGPIGKVRHSGTYFANPLCIAAGLACLRDVMDKKAYAHINRLGANLAKGVADVIKDSGVKATVASIGSVGLIYFLDKAPVNYREAAICDKDKWYKYWISMMNEGVMISGNTWHQTWFISAAHTDEDIQRTIEAVQKTVATLS